MNFNEDYWKRSIITKLENLGWQRKIFPSQNRGMIIKNVLNDSLKKINNLGLLFSDEVCELTLERFKENIDLNSSLFELNRIFHNYLINGFYLFVNGKDFHVKLLDEKIQNNTFYYCEEFSTEYNRQDIILFVNGLPLVIIECKSPFKNGNQIEHASQQIKIYRDETPSLFYFNVFSILTNKHVTKYGTITANNLRDFWYWKENIEQILDPRTILDLLRNFVFFNKERNEKIIAQNHQYIAAKKFYWLLQKQDNKKGIIQHSQGAGKSILMIFLAKQIINFSPASTILIITDRNQLDDQIHKKFNWAKEFLSNWKLSKIDSRNQLERELNEKRQGGIVFHTLQKIKKDITDPWNTRNNIYIIVDEAHRSWYGEKAKLIASEDFSYEERYGLANWIRIALPGASRLGMTATPIEQNDRSTRDVFGEIIHVYSREESVEDNITVGIFYYDRIVAPLGIEREEDWYKFSEIKREDIICDWSRLQEVVKKFVEHYEEMKKSNLLVSNKALFVTSSRKHAYRIYRLLLKIGFEKQEVCLDVTVSKESGLDSEIKEVIGNKEQQKKNFSDFQNKETPSIMVVVEKYTTGFDMPKLQLIYIDKYINQFHSLEQTVMRVNRHYQENLDKKEKDKGILIDFIGLGTNIEKVSTIIKYEEIAEQAEKELIEIEEKFSSKDLGSLEEIETILENESQRDFLKRKVRKLRSLYRWGQNKLTKNQREKIKKYMSIDNYLCNIENAGQENDDDLKKSSLNLTIGKRRNKSSGPTKIDELLEKAKSLYKSHAKCVSLYSLWGNMQPQLRKLGSRVNKEYRKKIKELLDQYNSYEDLATSLQKIIEEAGEKLKELERDNDKKEIYPYYNLLTDEEIFEEEIKEKISKEVASEIKISQGENIDFLKKESNKAKFTNNLRLLLCKHFPKDKREILIEDILREIEFIHCPEKPISNKSGLVI